MEASGLPEPVVFLLTKEALVPVSRLSGPNSQCGHFGVETFLVPGVQAVHWPRQLVAAPHRGDPDSIPTDPEAMRSKA